MFFQQISASLSKATSWVKRLSTADKISYKIAAGYTLVLSVAVLGTTTGLILGSIQEKAAREQAERGHEEGILLTHLQTSVLQARSHQQQLAVLLSDSVQFQQKYLNFLDHIQRIESLLREAEDLLAESEDREISRLLERYSVVPQIYLQQLQDRLIFDNINELDSSKIIPIQQSLLDFDKTPIVQDFDQLSNELSIIAERSFAEELEAEKDLDKAIKLRWQIIASSIIYSIALAILIAIYTSRAIAQPIQKVTEVARQATQDSNFELQAPVTTHDEIGILATSFNQLIQRVKTLLEEQQAEQEARLLENEKMSSLGRMLAGVAHEINNPVNFIYGNLIHANDYMTDLLGLLQLYQEKVPNPPAEIDDRAEEIDVDFLIEDLPKVVNSMQVGADRICQIVLSLKNFSRLDDSDPHSVNLHECLDSTLLILNNRLKKDIQVNRNYGKIPTITGYTGLLYQVFMNIISNAVDALQELPELAHKEITITTESLNSDWVAVRIVDNGSGISIENQSQIYNAFFTTKPRGVGTGLGLAISHQIITEKQGGQLLCKSQLGEGTEFSILLPIQPNITTNPPVASATCPVG